VRGPRRAVVIGAGLGGLATAIRLLALGLDVTVVERAPAPGGRAARLVDRGYTWDTGPSLITMPWLLDELLAVAGRDAARELTLRPLDPFYRLLWPEDGVTLDFAGDRERLRDAVAALSPADAANLDGFLDASRRIHERAVLVAGRQAFERPSQFLRLLPAMLRLRAAGNLAAFTSRYLSEPHVHQAFSFHSLYVGGDPFRVPAVYAALAYLQLADGVWYADGGTYAVVEALVRAIEGGGGRVVCDDGAEEILVRGGRAVAVRCASGAVHPAEVVVSNADAVRTRTRLLRGAPDTLPWRLRGPRNSMSCLLLYLGCRRRFPALLHHTLVAGPGYRRFVDDVTRRHRLPSTVSLYVHAPVRTEEAMAPPGGDSLAVLLPVPNLASGDDWDRIGDAWRDRVVRYLEEDAGLDGLEASIEVEHRMTPLDFLRRFDADEGNAFGTEPLLTRSAYFRQPNRDRTVRGLYHVGAGVHPGAGVPGVLLSAEVTGGLVQRDLRRG